MRAWQDCAIRANAAHEDWQRLFKELEDDWDAAA
jgi:hypothetical protein